MEEPNDSNSSQPLIFRSYRRHRRQAKWGTWSLFVPLVTLLWAIFWYLMMKRPSLPSGGSSDHAWMWIVLLIGAATITSVGISLAVAGLLDADHKHTHAATGLAINAFLLIASLLILFMRVFSQTVG